MMVDGVCAFPDSDVARFRAAGYWRGEVLGDILRAHTHGDRVALIMPGGRVTYAMLDRQADRLAAGFAASGIAAGDRVVVQLLNDPTFVATSIALFRLGALPVFALPKHRRNEISYLVDHSEAVALVVPAHADGYDYRELAREVSASSSTLDHVFVAGDAAEFTALTDIESPPIELQGPAPSDVAFFLLSGGTTGYPKLIPRTHDDYSYQLRATAEALHVDATSVYLAALPVAHNAALGCPGLLGTLAVGGAVVLAPSLSPDEYFPLIGPARVTHTTLMPPVAMLWLELAPLLGVDVSNVLLQIGGAPMSPHNANRIMAKLRARMSHWFGMAEGLLTYTRLDDPVEVIASSVGRPLCPDDEIRIVDERGGDAPPGIPGELWTRGPYTIRGYYRADDYNEEAFSDGYLRTGDLARRDADGNLAIVGRIKDVIIRGGEKVSAEELEHLLGQHPAIRDVAVVGRNDDSVGERIWAYVVQSTSLVTLAEVRTYLASMGVAEFKLVDHVVSVDTLPRTKVGKIDKAALRARANGSAA